MSQVAWPSQRYARLAAGPRGCTAQTSAGKVRFLYDGLIGNQIEWRVAREIGRRNRRLGRMLLLSSVLVSLDHDDEKVRARLAAMPDEDLAAMCRAVATDRREALGLKAQTAQERLNAQLLAEQEERRRERQRARYAENAANGERRVRKPLTDEQKAKRRKRARLRRENDPEQAARAECAARANAHLDAIVAARNAKESVTAA
jgi:hypothetical protein